MRLFVPEGMDKGLLGFLSRRFECIAAPANPAVEKPVANHIDLQIFPFSDKTAVVAPFCLDFYAERLPDFTLIPGAEPKSPYPHDIPFNCFICGGCLFCNEKYTDEALLALAAQRGLKRVGVRQGYTKCSTIVIDSQSLITADEGIAAAAEREGIRVLRTVNCGVCLPGYEYGFIGGCAFADGEGLYFCGDISRHGDFGKIRAFSSKPVYYAENLPLRDYGIIPPL